MTTQLIDAPRARPPESRIVRGLYLALGLVFLAIAIVGIAASLTFTGTVVVGSVAGRVALGTLAVALCAFVLTRPTKRPVEPGAHPPA